MRSTQRGNVAQKQAISRVDGAQLHGVLRDVLSVWENAQAQHHLNSIGTAFGNDIGKGLIKTKIVAEFAFFDIRYWESKTKALINIMIMAHGS